MASILEVRDYRKRNCWKCGTQISGSKKDLGRKYARTRRLLMSEHQRARGSHVRSERGWVVANCKYYCQDCYTDGRGNPLIT